MSAAATTQGWRKAKLEDLVFLQRGFDITQAQQKPGSIPVSSSSGITSYHNEFKVRAPGVVIGRKGTLGSIHFTAVDYWPHDTTLWSKDFKGNNPRFAYYFLHTLDFKRFDVGNSNPTLNRNHIHDLPVRIPPLPAQAAIANALSAYDDLIENNRRRMALLEESARLLYREWFVRLHFPGHEHTGIVEGIPNGWAPKTLGDICSEIRDQVSPLEMEPHTPYIGLEHIPRRSISLCDWGVAEAVTSTKHKYKEDDVIFGKIRPYFHKVGLAFNEGVTSSDSVVIRANSENHRALVLLTCSSDEFVAEASQTMREGSKMPRADWKLMTRYPLYVPPQALLRNFEETVAAITDQLRNLCFQNRNLKFARDLLLPRLVSGEITI